ncbi:zinc finger, C2H2 type [Ancylostoma duodenale]|uniref:Zinc finger, C2H2 type n=1 Tax=Ancylostoma duodenale TaxID=51022 RepID=A0A0C2E066_9BILA|nr:zinc finger, C2H2 type [Ancylostoma duodenale]
MVEIAEMPSMTVEEPSPCPQCPKTFANVRLLQQHQQMFHSDKTRQPGQILYPNASADVPGPIRCGLLLLFTMRPDL